MRDFNEMYCDPKAEELCMEERRDGEARIKELRKQLTDAQAVVTKQLSNETTANTYKQQTLELQHKVANLDDTIKRLQAERERDVVNTARLDDELEDWKSRFEAKCNEFDVQVGRFLALKKSFNKVHAENERLQANQRTLALRCGVGEARTGTLRKGPNSTWPTNKGSNGSAMLATLLVPATARAGAAETIRIIDLTEQFLAGSGGGAGGGGGGVAGYTGSGNGASKSPRGSVSEQLVATLPRVMQQRRKQSEDASAAASGEALPAMSTHKLQK